MDIRSLGWLLALALVTGCTSHPAQSAPQSDPVAPAEQPGSREAASRNSDAKVLAEFKAKVDDYARVRDTLAAHSLPLKKTSDPEAITAAERSLAEKIRQTRPAAHQGEFFTPQTVAAFKRLMKFPLKGPEGAENKNAIKDDVPEKVPFRVNAEYPKEQTVSTVAPDVLLNLPALPDDVQYRFVGRHMILYDARSNLIIDYFVNAIS
jgi:hypothetical protein